MRVDLKKDYHTNESRGFGFVTMATPAEYRKVFEHPSGHRLKGNDLRLKEAKKSIIFKNMIPTFIFFRIQKCKIDIL